MNGDRYARQLILKQIGRNGQMRLARARVAIIGCGALGSHQAELLARAGVGFLRLIDRDVVEWNNLPRQTLFDEEDARRRLPKAMAAAQKLKRINSEVTLDPRVSDFTPANAEKLVESVELVLDGSDNFETRYLINDVCSKHALPWLYGGVLGTGGMTMVVLPGRGPCLRCLFPRPPEPGSLPTCETEGVLGTAPAAIAARQATDAMRVILEGESIRPVLTHIDMWSGECRTVEVLPHPQCPCCRQHRFEFLAGEKASLPVRLCGREAVQVSPAEEMALDLDELEKRLRACGETSHNGWLVTLKVPPHELWFFPDGRVMVKGTSDTALARSLVSRYLGT